MHPLKSPRIVCFFASNVSRPILHLDALLAVAHHFWVHHNYVIFFAPKTKTPRNSIFPFKFEDSKICQNDLWSLKSDETFQVDTFSSDFVCKSYGHFTKKYYFFAKLFEIHPCCGS
jgi:hypothetical protein